MTILSALVDRYERMAARNAVPVPGFSSEKIGFAISLHPDGSVAGVQPLGETVKGTLRPQALVVPQPPKRASGISPGLLWDKTAYVFGATHPETGSKRAAKEHAAFKERQGKAIGETDDEGLKAFLAMLDIWEPGRFAELPHADVMLDANVVFRLDGELRYLHERPAALAIVANSAGAGQAKAGLCLVTGAQAPIARLHTAIKGVRDAQPSGASIVSFNQPSFTSYGKEQGDNAPVSVAAVFAYTTALNTLLANRRRRVQIGDATVVFWSTVDSEAEEAAAEQATDLLAIAIGSDAGPPPEAVEGAVEEDLLADLSAIAKGRPVPGLGNRSVDPDTRFYVLGLSPNAARLSIRFWLETTLGVLAERLGRHYEDLRLDPSAWKTPPSVRRLVTQLAPLRQKAGGRVEADLDHIPSHLSGELTRAILTGGRYPMSLLTLTLSRLRADHQVTGLRAAMIKATLKRRNEEVPVSLAKDETNTGYRLGRLFAVLENLQVAGIGKVNAGIRDRYIGAASATPARVFPVLLRGAENHHSAALKKKGWEAGRAVNLEKEIRQIMNGVPADEPFPATLELDDQGRFFVGYYQQQASFFAGHGSVPDAADPAGLPDSEETSDS